MNPCLFNPILLYTFLLMATTNRPFCSPMPSNHNAVRNFRSVGQFSTRYLLQDHDADRGKHTKPSRESQAINLTHPTVHRVGRGNSTPDRPSVLTKGNVFGFRLHTMTQNLTKQDNTSVDRLLLSPQSIAHPYPIYRFYSPVTQAYLTAPTDGRLVTASSKDPFNEAIEWEWIPVPNYSALYLRHVQSRKFLCFNKNGRPSIMKQAYFPLCLLRINAFVNRSTKFSRVQKTTVLNTSEQTFMQSVVQETGTRFKPPVTFTNLEIPQKPHYVSPDTKTRGQWNQSQRRHIRDVSLKKNIPVCVTDKNAVLNRFNRQVLNVPKPQLVWLSTAAHLPLWRLHFCTNGMPFAHLKPHHSRCAFPHLTRLSEVLILCPKVPIGCIRACETRSTTAKTTIPPRSNQIPNCSKECLRRIACYSDDGVNRLDFSRISRMPQN